MNPPPQPVTNSSSPTGKIALFRSLFREREDVYPRRFESRKDALLQQNDYLVLRFLAEDVGKQLDSVLDAVLAALAYRSPTNP